MDMKKMRKYRDLITRPVDFIFLDSANRYTVLANPNFKIKELNEREANILRTSLSAFQSLAGEENPFFFYSKLAFLESLRNNEQPNPELVLRFIADRAFYFAEYRDCVNLPGDNQGIYPFPGLESLALYETIWELAAQTPIDLLRAGRERLPNSSGYYIGDEAASSNIDALKNNAAKAAFDQLIQPYFPYAYPDKMLKSIFCEYDIPGLSADDMRCAADALFYPYEALLRNHQYARMACENKWLPTTAHRYLWQEMETNYSALQEALFRRESELSTRNRILKELNRLATASQSLFTENSKPCIPKMENIYIEIVMLFETYVRSLLHVVRNSDYFPILTYPDRAFSDRPYTMSITRLLSACYKGEKWHPLTPLFLYHAFSNNTKVILQNSKAKLVRKIREISTPARIVNMTSMTGRRAAVNLVLYSKLLAVFGSRNRKTCLFDIKSKDCRNLSFKHLYRSKMKPDGCYDKPPANHTCPFVRTEAELNDFGFALTSGYANLYHHFASREDCISLTSDEVYSEKSTAPKSADTYTENAPRFPIFRYSFHFAKPVGVLEGTLSRHIRACIPNQPRYLSPVTPNSYRRREEDPFFTPYEDLAAILLQDMHLPAMLRICRKIKKIISMHPEYLTVYRAMLMKPTATGELTHFLLKIIDEHGLSRQTAQYSSYRTSSRSYHIRDSIQNLLEYELRAQIYDNAACIAADLIVKTIDSRLLIYPAEDGLLRMIQEPIR